MVGLEVDQHYNDVYRAKLYKPEAITLEPECAEKDTARLAPMLPQLTDAYGGTTDGGSRALWPMAGTTNPTIQWALKEISQRDDHTMAQTIQTLVITNKDLVSHLITMFVLVGKLPYMMEVPDFGEMLTNPRSDYQLGLDEETREQLEQFMRKFPADGSWYSDPWPMIVNESNFHWTHTDPDKSLHEDVWTQPGETPRPFQDMCEPLIRSLALLSLASFWDPTTGTFPCWNAVLERQIIQFNLSISEDASIQRMYLPLIKDIMANQISVTHTH